MKFKPGDKVRFLNDVGGGSVCGTDVHGHVIVLTTDGFEIPVNEKDLVFSGNFTDLEREEADKIVVPETKREIPKPEAPPSESAAGMPRNVPPDSPVEFLLGIIPEDSGPVFQSGLACYLINDSDYYAYYLLGIREGGEFYHMASGLIEASTKRYIRSFDQTAISRLSDIHVQLMLVNEGKYSKKEPLDKLVSLSQVNFSKESYFRVNDYFEEKAVLFRITSVSADQRDHGFSIPEEAREQKLISDSSPLQVKKKEPAADTLEVDLHIDELGIQNSHIAPASILALQLSRFHAAMEEAVSKKLRRLVIIHGIGQGTLKMQIRKELQEKYPQYIFQDASFKEYGFGATLVHLTVGKQQ